MIRYLQFLIILISFSANSQIAERRVIVLMGSKFEITIVAKNKEIANNYIDSASAEITRIEDLISDWIPQSQVSQINANAGIKPVKVDKEVLELTERAIHFSEISDGAFDISFAAAEKIWKYDGSMTKLPTVEEVKESVKKIGYKNIIIDKENSTIFLKFVGMKIGFGSIGKGYAADKAKELMITKGVSAGIINASGDINTWEKQPNGKEWTIGITNPVKKDKIVALFGISGTAIVTSGNYEKFIEIDNKRYSHIIDPRTGYPSTGIASVTIFAESAELANGISTSIMVLGIKKGLELIKNQKVLAIIIDDKGKIYCSDKKALKKIRRKIFYLN